MFFEEEKIIAALNCKNCHLRLDVPRLLPCGRTICSSCYLTIQVVNKRFECITCSNNHLMPDDGLPLNESLLLLLSVKPSEIYRSKSVEILKQSLNDIYSKMKSIEMGVNNGIDKIKEHCVEIRREVQLATEETIQLINNYNEELIKRIDDYEKEYSDLFELDSSVKQEFKQTINDLEAFHTEWCLYLKQLKIDDEVIFEANETASLLNQKADEKKTQLDFLIFNEYILKFERNSNRLCKSVLGLFTTQSLKTVQSNILSHFQMIELITLCNFSLNQKWNLIYRATQDGFASSSFHSRCDTKRSTLTIVKTNKGYVFGGYNDLDWSGSSGYKNDPNSFLFSYINIYNKPIKMKCHLLNNSIYCKNDYGPVFGGGHDLFICNNSNVNNQSYSNIGHSFTHPDYSYQSNEAKSFLASSYNFQIADIEVYYKD